MIELKVDGKVRGRAFNFQHGYAYFLYNENFTNIERYEVSSLSSGERKLEEYARELSGGPSFRQA
jgi:ABC-type lipopolysaccharide export system ATPase subunit